MTLLRGPHDTRPSFVCLSNVCQQSRAHRPHNATGATPTVRLAAETPVHSLRLPLLRCCIGKELAEHITRGDADVFVSVSFHVAVS